MNVVSDEVVSNECVLKSMWSEMTVVSNQCGLKWTWSQMKKSHVNVVSNEQVSNEQVSNEQVSNDCGLKW